MRTSVIHTLLFAILLAGCTNKEKEARSMLDKARNMYERDELISAKNEIDSIRAWYPKEFGVLKETLELMRLVELKEAERAIAFCDSFIPVKQAESVELSKGFIFEKDSVYEEIGNYIWKQQTIERNVERSYIRCGVNEKGEMYLTSVYFGSAPINHTGIKASTKEGTYTETASIPYDGGLNYRFKDAGNISEIVNYKGEHCADVAHFIYTNNKERIKIDYTGGKPYTIYLSDTEKKAIVATYDLTTVLSDIERIKTEKEKALKKQTYLKGKLK
ncbi:MAG: hypothetical protein LBQ39_02740 [Tannerellaceae bacterium]|jgi:uncharacterized protein YcgI (DUF1989 family)|nr:hypothetical protein [Tannerellaceae bacterium]